MNRVALVGACTAVLAGLILTPTPTALAADEGLPGAPVSMAGASSPYLASVSPSGCYGQSNNPHISTSAATRGKIKGYAFSKCSSNVISLSVRTSLWRHRWFGYEEVDSSSGTATPGYKIGRSGIYSCQNNTWRTVGKHTSVESSGTYSAETANYQDITGC